MARDFSKVSPQIWESERFKSLADDSARLAYLYLLSNGHQNSIGCYRLPTAYACADMGWPAPKFEAALAALVAADLVEADKHSAANHIPAVQHIQKKTIPFCQNVPTNSLK